MIARYKFCLWLVNMLFNRRLTLAQITELWSRSDSNIYGMSLTPRTFIRYKALTEEIFNVNIECHKPTNEYWLDVDALDDSDRWIMSALRVQNLSSMSGMRRHIILENPPAGQNLLETVANACNDSRVLKFTYKSPYRQSRTCEVIPLFVKLFKQRWYATCQPLGKDYLTTFALERISDLKVGEKCARSLEVDADEYFADCYGIIHQLEPEKIVVRAFRPQDSYLKEVPLHHSQQVEDENDEWTDFSFYVRPTYDFKQDLLWHRDKLAVLSPEWLKEDMLDILARMSESYKSGLPDYKDE